MPKEKATYNNNRKYNSSWESKFDWLENASYRSEYGVCKLCRCDVKLSMSDLNRHEKSCKHERNMSSSSRTTYAPELKKKVDSHGEKVKIAELQLAVAMTCHSATHTIDHLSEIIVKHGEGSPLAQMRMQRTKCSNLIKSVISASLKQDLIEDLKNKKYALIIDGSTQKYLCVMLRYFSTAKNEICTAFICLISIQEASGGNLVSDLIEEIEKCGLRMRDCIGFAADGASKMMRSNNSVWSKIKELSPHCVQLKCICHSLALCIQNAFAKLPTLTGLLLVEIPNYFRNSNVRSDAFKDLFEVFNSSDGEIARCAPLPFEKTSSTRWLMWGKVLHDILMNWEELKAYFLSVESSEIKFETRYKALLIRDMLHDWKNKLFFQFATPLVQEFERVNLLFQKDKADPHEIHYELYIYYKSLKSRIMDVNNCKKPISHVDFGKEFLLECDNVLRQEKNSREVQSEIEDVKVRCLSVLKEAVSQVDQRLPPARNIYRDLSKLHPQVVLNQATRPKVSDLPFLHLAEKNLNVIKEQYKELPFVDWGGEYFREPGGIPTESEEFWKGVFRHGQFQELATFALTCLVTPVSNDVIERVFSLLSTVKSRSRSRIQLPLLDAVLRVRTEFLLTNRCCRDFVPTQRMIQKSEFVYPSNFRDNEDVNASDDDFF